MIERARAVPGVSAAGVINHAPLTGDAWGTGAIVEGREHQPPVRAIWRVSGPGLLETLRVPLRDGRAFTDRDEAGSPPVVLVNERFYYPGDSYATPDVAIDLLAAPKMTFAVHDAPLSEMGLGMAHARIEGAVQAGGGEHHRLSPGDAIEF